MCLLEFYPLSFYISHFFLVFLGFKNLGLVYFLVRDIGVNTHRLLCDSCLDGLLLSSVFGLRFKFGWSLVVDVCVSGIVPIRFRAITVPSMSTHCCLSVR